MNVIKRAIETFGGKASDWRMIGEAAVHASVTPNDQCRFPGPAIVRGGEFLGGTFYGGLFFHGAFYAGEFYAGEFFDGTFFGGTFRDGIFRGGTFRGGTFHGGVFCGGEFRGGEFRRTPIQIIGLIPWSVVVQGDGDDRIAVGCECHSLDEWRRDIKEIAAGHKVARLATKVLAIVEFAASRR